MEESLQAFLRAPSGRSWDPPIYLGNRLVDDYFKVLITFITTLSVPDLFQELLDQAQSIRLLLVVLQLFPQDVHQVSAGADP